MNEAGLNVVITGASSGIGEAVARELFRGGHRVVLAARRVERLQTLARELSPSGFGVLVVQADVSVPDDRARLVKRARDVFGPIDVLVNNAGIGGSRGGPFWTREHPLRVVEVNLLALMDLSHRVLPDMVARGSGHVINVGSVAGHVATEPTYAASKFGVRGFSLALRRQLLGSGVHVSVVAPGFVRSEMTADLGSRLPGPEVVARAVSDLLSRPRAEVVVPGFYRVLIELERALPWLGDVVIHAVSRRRR